MSVFPRTLATALPQGVAGAWLMSQSFPEPGIYPLMFVGLALVIPAFRRLHLVDALALGSVVGFIYYGFLADWTTVYLGFLPWFGLVGVQAILVAVGGVMLTAAWRMGDGQRPRRTFPLFDEHPATMRMRIVTALLVSAAWTSREAIAAVWPFGGFAWGRVIHSQADSVLGHLVTWWGTSGAGFLVVAVVTYAVLVLTERPDYNSGRADLIPALVALLVCVPLAAPFAVGTGDTIRVMAVQGNSNSALFADRQPGESITDHYTAMKDVLDEDVDVVVWPENAADVSPLSNDDAYELIDHIARSVDAPFVFGTITWEGDESFNSVLQWQAGVGPVDQYDKIHPVPFAEYLPAREFFYPLAPRMFDMVPRDYSFGTRDTVFDIDGVTAGVNICYDIVDDSIFRSMVASGAEVILAPTNNADFGRSEQSIQQLGIARIRAMETGRAVVNTSTVGVSAIIGPDGRDIARLEPFTKGVMIADVPLSTVITPAMIVGYPLEQAIILLGIAPLFVRNRRNA